MDASKFQSEVDRLLKEKEETEKAIIQQTSSIIDEKNNNIEKIIAMQKEQQEMIQNQTANILSEKKSDIQQLVADQLEKQTQKDYNEEEMAYVNSDGYKNFKNVISNIEPLTMGVFNELVSKYYQQINFYNNPFFKPISGKIRLAGIGFPIPDIFLEQLKQAIQMKMDLNLPEDAISKVEIFPVEYANQSENFIKRVNEYQVIVSLQQRKKENTELKTK